MARGKKRMWAGVTLVSLGVLAGGMVVASRWYAFQLVTDRGADREQWELVAGAMQWVRAPTSHMVNMGAASPGVFMIKLTRPGIDFFLESSNPVSALPGMTGFEWRGVCWYYAEVPGSLALSSVIVWPIPLFFLIAGVVPLWSGWRVRRRVRSGGCLGCGYDLSATPDTAPCPECGAARAEARMPVH